MPKLRMIIIYLFSLKASLKLLIMLKMYVFLFCSNAYPKCTGFVSFDSTTTYGTSNVSHEKLCYAEITKKNLTGFESDLLLYFVLYFFLLFLYLEYMACGQQGNRGEIKM